MKISKRSIIGFGIGVIIGSIIGLFIIPFPSKIIGYQLCVGLTMIVCGLITE